MLNRFKNFFLLLLALVVAGLCYGVGMHFENMEKFGSEKMVVHDLGKFLSFDESARLESYLNQLADAGHKMFIVTVKKTGSSSDFYINTKLKKHIGKFDSFILVNSNKKKEVWFSHFKVNGIKGVKLKEFKSGLFVGNELEKLLDEQAVLSGVKFQPAVAQVPPVTTEKKVRGLIFVIGFAVTIFLGMWMMGHGRPWIWKQGILFAVLFFIVEIPAYYLPTFFFLGVAMAIALNMRRPLTLRF